MNITDAQQWLAMPAFHTSSQHCEKYPRGPSRWEELTPGKWPRTHSYHAKYSLLHHDLTVTMFQVEPWAAKGCHETFCMNLSTHQPLSVKRLVYLWKFFFGESAWKPVQKDLPASHIGSTNLCQCFLQRGQAEYTYPLNEMLRNNSDKHRYYDGVCLQLLLFSQNAPRNKQSPSFHLAATPWLPQLWVKGQPVRGQT